MPVPRAFPQTVDVDADQRFCWRADYPKDKLPHC